MTLAATTGAHMDPWEPATISHKIVAVQKLHTHAYVHAVATDKTSACADNVPRSHAK